MERNVVSFKAIKFEKMYKLFYQDINNFNRALMMVGTAPKNPVEFSKVKIS
jgi:hypothetical protein